MVSILILTLNEERNLPRCLKSVKWSDDIVVFDSMSSDSTAQIAEQSGARVIKHRFENYGRQREAARQLGRFKHEWVLSLDADEEPDAALTEEIQSIAGRANVSHKAFRMRRKDHFQGKWIKYSTLYPSWFVRFYKHKEIHYDDRAVHEYPVVNGATGEFKGHLLHDNFSKGMDHWWEKHLRYAGLEAGENIKALHSGTLDFQKLVSLNPVERRRALKHLSIRLPFRPFLRFFYMFVLHRGFLDGSPGYHYCRLLARYEYMIVLKMREIQRRQAGLSI